jgi:hypothetical protein
MIISLPLCRLHMDPVSGLELTAGGWRKRRWQWHNQREHVHAPPIQPIIQGLSPHTALRIQRQDNVVLTFHCAKRSARFQVGANLKVQTARQPSHSGLGMESLVVER